MVEQPGDLDGIDVAGTVARLGVPVDSLYRMLRRFAADDATTVADLRAASTAPTTRPPRVTRTPWPAPRQHRRGAVA